jgi:ribosomal protein L16 Arg81 hydroxylase
MQRNSMLSDDECEQLHQMIGEAMNNSQIAEWFDGTWSEVRNEHSIIVPDGVMYRPDRVMISENRTVVVDYKFGLEQKASYTRQIANYCDLLRQMGYENVEGYIWYIALGEVVAVNN